MSSDFVSSLVGGFDFPDLERPGIEWRCDDCGDDVPKDGESKLALPYHVRPSRPRPRLGGEAAAKAGAELAVCACCKSLHRRGLIHACERCGGQRAQLRREHDTGLFVCRLCYREGGHGAVRYEVAALLASAWAWARFEWAMLGDTDWRGMVSMMLDDIPPSAAGARRTGTAIVEYKDSATRALQTVAHAASIEGFRRIVLDYTTKTRRQYDDAFWALRRDGWPVSEVSYSRGDAGGIMVVYARRVPSGR